VLATPTFCRCASAIFCLLVVSRCHYGNFARSCRSTVCGFAVQCAKASTCALPIAALRQASVAERQLSSRLNGGEAVMSRALRSRRSKRNTDRKTARPALFDPAVFLETTEAPGDSRHHARSQYDRSVKRGCRLSRRCARAEEVTQGANHRKVDPCLQWQRRSGGDQMWRQTTTFASR
jgi:hypothetical protein